MFIELPPICGDPEEPKDFTSDENRFEEMTVEEDRMRCVIDGKENLYPVVITRLAFHEDPPLVDLVVKTVQSHTDCYRFIGDVHESGFADLGAWAWAQNHNDEDRDVYVFGSRYPDRWHSCLGVGSLGGGFSCLCWEETVDYARRYGASTQEELNHALAWVTLHELGHQFGCGHPHSVEDTSCVMTDLAPENIHERPLVFCEDCRETISLNIPSVKTYKP